jgi:uncharacterized ferritin-like protein (DUF455 family)
MIARPSFETQVLGQRSARAKIAMLPGALDALLRGRPESVPTEPGRDVEIRELRELPPKPGLSSALGQARLLHDLASIELQALELCVRTLSEYPEAPRRFREQLTEVAADEGRHLGLCLDALDDLGYPWGSFPTHLGLWRAVRAGEPLLDRILIVHRYLEGSGLDASDSILRRLGGVRAPEAAHAVGVIRRDEVGHVKFGGHWYREIARAEGLDPADDFAPRLNSIATRVPRRLEPIRRDLRTEAGFTPREIDELEALRRTLAKPN